MTNLPKPDFQYPLPSNVTAEEAEAIKTAEGSSAEIITARAVIVSLIKQDRLDELAPILNLLRKYEVDRLHEQVVKHRLLSADAVELYMYSLAMKMHQILKDELPENVWPPIQIKISQEWKNVPFPQNSPDQILEAIKVIDSRQIIAVDATPKNLPPPVDENTFTN
jgi:hypothetical protein